LPAPQKKGLRYFSFDVGFFGDRKIKLLRGEHGADGIEVYQRLLCKIYNDNGYYFVWNDEEDFELLADETGYSIEKVRLIFTTLLRRSLFDNTLFERGNVLSSSGIQRRYFEAVKETKIKAAASGRYTYIENDICLLSEDDFFEFNKSTVWLCLTQKNSNSTNNYNNSTNNNSNSTNNPAKKSKVNKSKLNESKSKVTPPAADEPSPTVTVTLTTPKEKVDFTEMQITELSEQFPDVDIVRDIEKMQEDIDNMPKCNLYGQNLADYITRWFNRSQMQGGNRDNNKNGTGNKSMALDADDFYARAVKKSMKL